MSPVVKSTFVVVGLFAFCAIPIAGPGIGVAADAVVQYAFGVDDETKVEYKKTLSDPEYQTENVKKAIDCCRQVCNLDWDFMADRCVLLNRTATNCYAGCEAPEKAAE